MRLGQLAWLAALVLNGMVSGDAEGTVQERATATARLEETWRLIDHAALARYLMHEADYGVAATHSSLQPGWPFANVLSVSDGPKNESTGRIIFYVATQSVFVADVRGDARMAFTVSQEQTPKGCRFEDPEWPLCARATVVGHAWEVGPKERREAARLMFARHPQMRVWAHLAHKWAFYELDVSHVEILDFFGGFHTVNSTDYFRAKPHAPLWTDPHA